MTATGVPGLPQPLAARARATALLWGLALAGAIPGRLSAQTPPAHIPFCIGDSGARRFLERVRYLLRSPGAGEVRRRSELGLERPPETGAWLVTDDALCASASVGVAAALPERQRPAPPFPITLVQAGSRYLVDWPSPNGVKRDWDLLVLDSTMRPVSPVLPSGPRAP